MTQPASIREALLERAEDGYLSFERFMRFALYHPRHGYYARYAQDVGKRGDFSTAATLHPALAKAIAHWARAREGITEWIEVGAGDGSLARSILRGVGWWRRRAIRYRIVEVSPTLQTLQQQQLKGCNVYWYDSLARALGAAGGKATILANELVDAFPCVRLEWDGERWMEVGLSITSDSSAEALREPPPRIVPHLPKPWPEIAAGQRCEVQVAYREWLEEWLPKLARGNVLTIDYGDVYPRLYRRRPGGTVRAYFRHERYDRSEVYQRIGRQDLTCDVDFSDLRRWGTELGLVERAFVTQREFLLEHLPSSKASSDPALAFLLDENGAGNAFRVLWQER